MNDSTAGFLFIGVILLILVVALWAGYRSIQTRRMAWRELATLTGLGFEGEKWYQTPRITGVYHRHSLTLDTFTRRHGKSSTTYTRLVLQVENPSNLRLAISDENLFGKIGKMVGMQDFQMGDEELDRRFVFQGEPESVVMQLLSSINLRARLLEVHSIHLKLDGTSLYFQQVGVESNTEYLRFLFDLLSDLAGSVERLDSADSISGASSTTSFS